MKSLMTSQLHRFHGAMVRSVARQMKGRQHCVAILDVNLGGTDYVLTLDEPNPGAELERLRGVWSQLLVRKMSESLVRFAFDFTSDSPQWACSIACKRFSATPRLGNTE